MDPTRSTGEKAEQRGKMQIRRNRAAATRRKRR
uniref:Uncharacterized protein n=1 Tax=Arundo donax TaxID=35708 RepID=A0A0A9DSK0_ARUDO